MVDDPDSVGAIVDDPHSAGDVVTSIDAFGHHACASVDAKDVFVDDYDPAEDAHTSVDGNAIDDDMILPQIGDRHPDSDCDVVTSVDALCQHSKDVLNDTVDECYRLDQTHVHRLEYVPEHIKNKTTVIENDNPRFPHGLYHRVSWRSTAGPCATESRHTSQ